MLKPTSINQTVEKLQIMQFYFWQDCLESVAMATLLLTTRLSICIFILMFSLNLNLLYRPEKNLAHFGKPLYSGLGDFAIWWTNLIKCKLGKLMKYFTAYFVN